MTSRLSSWRRQQSNKFFALYAVILFALAAAVLGRAWVFGELVLHGPSGALIAVGGYMSSPV